MGGKGGGDSGDFVPQNQSARAMLTEQQPTPAQKSAQLGTPYQQPTQQQLAEQQAQQQARQPRRFQRPDAAMDPNAIAGAGRGAATSTGDVAAQSVLPRRGGRQRRAAGPPPSNGGSV